MFKLVEKIKFNNTQNTSFLEDICFLPSSKILHGVYLKRSETCRKNSTIAIITFIIVTLSDE